MDSTNLLEVLAWVAGGTGAGIVAYAVMNKIKWQEYQAETKRYVSLALSVVLAWAAWFALLWFGAQAAPTTAQGWIQTLFAVAMPALLSAQSLHGATALRAADIQERQADILAGRARLD